MIYRGTVEDMIGFIHYENLLIIKLLLETKFPEEKAEKEYEKIEKKLSNMLEDVVNGEFKIFDEK